MIQTQAQLTSLTRNAVEDLRADVESEELPALWQRMGSCNRFMPTLPTCRQANRLIESAVIVTPELLTAHSRSAWLVPEALGGERGWTSGFAYGPNWRLVRLALAASREGHRWCIRDLGSHGYVRGGYRADDSRNER